jgi:uncharacterized protein
MTERLCDVNVWLAATLSLHPQNAAAQSWLNSNSQRSSIVFCRATQQSFLRLLTTKAVMERANSPALTNADAWALFERLMSDQRFVLRTDEPAGISDVWRRYSARGTSSPHLWMDSYLAAFAATAGYQLVTLDRAFRQFPGLDLLLLDG